MVPEWEEFLVVWGDRRAQKRWSSRSRRQRCVPNGLPIPSLIPIPIRQWSLRGGWCLGEVDPLRWQRRGVVWPDDGVAENQDKLWAGGGRLRLGGICWEVALQLYGSM